MTDAQALKRRLRDASAAVAAARRTLENGDIVDLGGLEKEIREICGGIASLPVDQAQDLKSPLLSLTDTLDLLGKDLKTMHERLAGEIKGLNARQQATKAYGGGKAK